MKRRRLLIPGVLFGGLVVLLSWLSGLRVEHVRFLIQSLSEPPKLSTEETAELHRWLRQNAIHLNSVEAGSGSDDMQPLRALIGDARVVALGEASHWNREFSQAKHRMAEFLVGEMGFTVFAIEATFAGALELNDYYSSHLNLVNRVARTNWFVRVLGRDQLSDRARINEFIRGTQARCSTPPTPRFKMDRVLLLRPP